MLAFIGRDRRDIGPDALSLVQRFLVTFERLHEVSDGRRPGHARGEDDEPHPHPRSGRRRHVRAELAQLRCPDVRVPTLVAGDPPERVGATRILLDGRERVVQDDRVAFQLQVVEALLDVDRGHDPILGHRRR